MAGMSSSLHARFVRQISKWNLNEVPDVGQAHAKGFRYTVGRLADGGYGRFWVGSQRSEAQQRAHAYRACWVAIVRGGGTSWSPAALEKAREHGDERVRVLRGFVSSMEGHAAFLEKAASDQRASIALTVPETAAGGDRRMLQPSDGGSASASGEATLYQAIDAYIESLKGKRRAQSHTWRAEQVVKRGLKAVRGDCPLSSVDYLWLDRLCDYYKSRPKSLRGKPKNRKPISPQTVKTTLQYLRQFFVWVDDTGFGGWEGPRKLTKPFRVRLGDLLTPAELRQAKTIQQFDVSTLVTLYHAASDHQRAIILTALFTAGTQQELAVLEKGEFDLDAGTLRHFRNKTRVEGRFWLPPELVTLLRAEFEEHRTKPLTFYTAQGGPLVTYRDGKLVSDSVRQMWDDLRETAGLPDALPFKYLRKYVADWMTRRGGDAMGQVALSHSRQSVLAKNYTSARDFEAFNGLQVEMHSEFVSAGMFADGKQRPRVTLRLAAG